MLEELTAEELDEWVLGRLESANVDPKAPSDAMRRRVEWWVGRLRRRLTDAQRRVHYDVRPEPYVEEGPLGVSRVATRKVFRVEIEPSSQEVPADVELVIAALERVLAHWPLEQRERIARLDPTGASLERVRASAALMAPEPRRRIKKKRRRAKAPRADERPMSLDDDRRTLDELLARTWWKAPRSFALFTRTLHEVFESIRSERPARTRQVTVRVAERALVEDALGRSSVRRLPVRRVVDEEVDEDALVAFWREGLERLDEELGAWPDHARVCPAEDFTRYADYALLDFTSVFRRVVVHDVDALGHLDPERHAHLRVVLDPTSWRAPAADVDPSLVDELHVDARAGSALSSILASKFSGLDVLRLEGLVLDAEPADALHASGALRRLRELSLHTVMVDEDVLARMLSRLGADHIEAFEIAYCHGSASVGVEDLLRRPLPRLRRLALAGDVVKGSVFDALRANDAIERLSELELSSSWSLSAGHVVAFFERARLTALRSLALATPGASDTLARTLTSSPALTRLESLDVRGSSMGFDALVALVEATNFSLTRLDFSPENLTVSERAMLLERVTDPELFVYMSARMPAPGTTTERAPHRPRFEPAPRSDRELADHLFAPMRHLYTPVIDHRRNDADVALLADVARRLGRLDHAVDDPGEPAEFDAREVLVEGPVGVTRTRRLRVRVSEGRPPSRHVLGTAKFWSRRLEDFDEALSGLIPRWIASHDAVVAFLDVAEVRFLDLFAFARVDDPDVLMRLHAAARGYLEVELRPLRWSHVSFGAMSRVRTLVVDDETYGIEHMRDVEFPRLSALTLRGESLDMEMLAHIERLGVFDVIDTLTLDGLMLSDDVASRLLEVIDPASLCELSVSETTWGSQGVEHLLSLGLTELQRLSLRALDLDPDALEVLVTGSTMTLVNRLELEADVMTDALARRLIESSSCSELHTLVLHGAHPDLTVLCALAASAELGLHTLVFDASRFGAAERAVLLESAWSGTLRSRITANLEPTI